MKKNRSKRSISVITVFLFLLLIVTMTAITVSSMEKKNALEIIDKSSGLTVTDFSLTNVETGEEKSDIIETKRGEYLQLKINLDYSGEPLKIGDQMTIDATQENEFGQLFNMQGGVTTEIPIYDNNGVELGVWTYKSYSAILGRFTITMTKDVTNFSNISIITSDNFMYRHKSKISIRPGILANLTIGNKTKQFLLNQEELLAANGTKIFVGADNISNDYVKWGIVSHGYENCQNAKVESTGTYIFEDSMLEARFTNLVKPLSVDQIEISPMMGMPATQCDGITPLFSPKNIAQLYFQKVYQNENETYEEFKTRVRKSGTWSMGVYKHSDSEYSFVSYEGDLLDAPMTYIDFFEIGWNTSDIVEVLDFIQRLIGELTEEQKIYYRQVYANSNSTNGKIQTLCYYIDCYYEPVSSNKVINQDVTLTDHSGTYTSSKTATLTPNYGLGSATTFNPIKKVWNDDENSKGLRPENAVVSVYQNGMLYKTLTLTKKDQVSANRWEQTIEDLPQYDENGNQYLYTAKEEKVVLSNGDEYFPSILGSTITNTLRGIVKYEVEKKWEDNNNEAGKRPEEVEIILKANGEEVRRQKLTEETNWKYTFTNLDKYDSNGKEITYTVDEEFTSEFYVKTIVGNVITNTFVVPEDKIKITGTKVWYDLEDFAGKRPESVVLQVKAEGVVVSEAVVNEENHWSYEFELAKYDRLGKEIEYVIDEKETSKFYEKELTDNKTVTNKFVVPDEKVKLKVEKVWEDQNDKYQKRPKSVTLQVKAGEKIVDEIEVSEKENWSYEFELPKYDELGNEIEYSIDEKETNQYYEKRIEKNKIINTCTYKEEVNTSDINVWIYLVISLVAIIGILSVLYFVFKRQKQ
ncbi:MAG: Cna B-type domain-containing protein [Clostridia bacterium]|nr:Cna B-type domain-containing protein [Clostridia bacterium]